MLYKACLAKCKSFEAQRSPIDLKRCYLHTQIFTIAAKPQHTARPRADGVNNVKSVWDRRGFGDIFMFFSVVYMLVFSSFPKCESPEILCGLRKLHMTFRFHTLYIPMQPWKPSDSTPTPARSL